MQTHFQTSVEVFFNYASGMVLAWLVNLYLLPVLGFQASKSQAAQLTFVMTAVSVVRSYVIRRIFNYLHRTK